MLCGSAFKNRGVQPMLDAVIDYLPSPLDVPAIEGARPEERREVIERHPDRDEPFSALAFKIVTHPFFGRLTYIRVYSGHLDSGGQIVNSTKSKKERIGKIFQMHANKENPVDSVTAGHIYAVIGLKDTTTGDTLCDSQHQVVLESMTFPEPVIEVAIEPKTKADQEKLGLGDPEARGGGPDVPRRAELRHRPDRHQGHGRAAPRHPRRPHEARVQASRRTSASPRSRTARRSSKAVEQSRLHAQEADRWIRPVREDPVRDRAARRRRRRRSTSSTNKVTGGRIPREYIPSVDQGFQDAMNVGVLAGYPMVGVKATLLDGAAHDVDSSEMAFKIAGSMGFKEAVRKANPVILEPIMAVEVRTPEEYMGDVIGDLNSRRGQIQSMEDAAGVKVVRALVPLSEMFGYIGDLRSKTSGRAVYSMEFDSYAEVPADRRRRDRPEEQGRIARMPAPSVEGPASALHNFTRRPLY